MNIISYCQNFKEIELARAAGVSELIVGHKQLSKFGNLESDSLNKLAKECRRVNIKPILEWDVLEVETSFNQSVQIISQLDLALFSAVRTQDPGAVEYLRKNHPAVKIQLLLENGNHNFVGINRWVDYLGDSLDRLVLSMELPVEVIKDYIKRLNVSIELLALGRILLFYTPRYLVSSLNSDYKKGVEVLGSSEESPHKGFPIIENDHGTFMFHIRDQFILDYIPTLGEINLDFIRVDLRFHKNFALIDDIAKLVKNFSSERAEQIKETYGEKTTRGYFSVNRTDVLFDKLKNQNVQRQDQNYLGEVLEMYKGKHTAITLKNPNLNLKLGDKIVIFTPERKTLECVVSRLQNSSLVDIAEGFNDSIVLINFIKKAGPRSAVYLA